jgi:hypothetical protein
MTDEDYPGNHDEHARGMATLFRTGRYQPEKLLLRRYSDIIGPHQLLQMIKVQCLCSCMLEMRTK